MAVDRAEAGAPHAGERRGPGPAGESELRRTLRALAAGAAPDLRAPSALAPRPLALVRLAALLASDPETESVSWAADLAAAAGAADRELVAVLIAVASCSRTVAASEGAARLAAALEPRRERVSPARGRLNPPV